MCQDKQMLISNSYREVGPLFGNELWKEGGIVEPTFSFGFQGFQSNEASFVDFGKPDPFRVQTGVLDNTTMVTFGFNDDFFWSTYC
jgi:hypothetical protein